MDVERQQLFKKQTTEQFAELGRFVQEFEHMVGMIRCLIIFLLNADQELTNIMLYHNALTARPLFDIMRAMFFVRLKKSGCETEISKALNEIVVQISKDFEKSISYRNTLLHGTWFIGWANSEAKDFSSFDLSRMKVTKTGIENSVVPKNLEELREITHICLLTRRKITALSNLVMLGEHKLAKFFKKNEKGDWELCCNILH